MNINYLFPSDKFSQFGIIIGTPTEVLESLKDVLKNIGILNEFSVSSLDLTGFSPRISLDSKIFDIRSAEIELMEAVGSNFSFYLCNLNDAWRSIFLGMLKILGGTGIFIRSSPDSERELEQYVQEVQIIHGRNTVRHIRVMYDRKWLFYEKGNRLEIEGDFALENRIRKKRLTRENLIAVLGEVAPAISCSEEFHSIKFDRLPVPNLSIRHR